MCFGKKMADQDIMCVFPNIKIKTVGNKPYYLYGEGKVERTGMEGSLL